MKRLPLLAVFILFLALCASVAYWGMQLFKPPVRNVAPAAFVPRVDAPLAAATGLFGGGGMQVAAASNFALTGVVVSGSARESVAIVSVDGKPGKAVRVNAELQPGVVVKEVHPQFIMLSDSGITRRIELPKNGARAEGPAALGVAPAPFVPQSQRVPPEVRNPPTAVMQPQAPLPMPPVQPPMPGNGPRTN